MELLKPMLHTRGGGREEERNGCVTYLWRDKWNQIGVDTSLLRPILRYL